MEPPVFENFQHGFRVTVFAGKLIGPDIGPDKRLVQILDLIKQNQKILLQELSEKVKVSKRTIRRDIEKLKAQNKLKRVGGEKTGFWEIIEK